LGAKSIEKLREHWERQNHERKHAGDRWQENELIFPSSVGTPVNHSNLVKTFKRVISLAGLPEIRFHDLRHTAARLMLNHGVPVIIVSRMLGHSKVSITLDIYGHLMPEIQHQAAVLMDELIAPIEIGLHPVAPDFISRTS
jgi:integrase